MIPSSHAATTHAPIRGRVATSARRGHLNDPDEQHERDQRPEAVAQPLERDTDPSS